jgi:YidC/Oxa1 family membrane protein insertase
VFIGLYNVLLNAIELRHAPFALWIQDLSSPEALMIGGISVPLMVLLLGVSMFLQQYSTPTAGLDPTQRKVMLFMPVILTGSFLIYPLPAGLTLYWLVNNTISVVQQVFLKTERRLNPYQATAIAGALMLVFAILLTKF